MSKRATFALFLWSLMILRATAVQVVAEGKTSFPHPGIPIVKIEAERLPDLNIPRSGNQLLVVGDEFVVTGGHTHGFVPTPTAEYFSEGQWHLIHTVYSHDFGTALLLKSGHVLLAGGTSENIGVGQTYTAEFYDPRSHSFNGFGSMEIRRAKASALELDSGKVVIAGNWYHDDGIELFDGKSAFTYVKNEKPRSVPYIIRTTRDDALIIGSKSNRDEDINPAIADRLRGDSVHIPLLEKWHPLPLAHNFTGESFIGDEEKELYSYLIPVEGDSGQVAIVKAENGRFSLLPTACPIPMQTHLGGIWYDANILADRQRQRAYLTGINSDFRTSHDAGYRYYALAIDYGQATDEKPAPLTLYYTDLLPCLLEANHALTDDGNLLLAGGFTENSYFKPHGMVYLLHTGNRVAAQGNGDSLHMPAVVGVGVATLLVALFFLYHRRRSHSESAVPADTPTDPALMNRICQLMEAQKLYLNEELKIADVASALGTNRAYISDCINSTRGCSFTQFVNTYRIEHAKHLLQSRPDIKLIEVWTSSGFSTERTFLRTFKSVTGMTPSEFRSKNH